MKNVSYYPLVTKLWDVQILNTNGKKKNGGRFTFSFSHPPQTVEVQASAPRSFKHGHTDNACWNLEKIDLFFAFYLLIASYIF